METVLPLFEKAGRSGEEGRWSERRGLARGEVQQQGCAGLLLKGHRLAIGGPGREDLSRLRRRGGVLLFAGLRVEQVDVLDAVLVRDVGEPLAVRRPRGSLLVEAVVGQGFRDGIADGEQVKLVERDEGDRLAVGRDRWSEDAFGLLGRGGVEEEVLGRVDGTDGLDVRGERDRGGGLGCQVSFQDLAVGRVDQARRGEPGGGKHGRPPPQPRFPVDRLGGLAAITGL